MDNRRVQISYFPDTRSSGFSSIRKTSSGFAVHERSLQNEPTATKALFHLEGPGLKGQKPVGKVSLRKLSLKLVLLLALTSAARAHELAALDLDHLTEKDDSWKFVLATHVKQSRPGHPNTKIYLPAYPDNTKLCVVNCLRACKARTTALRQSSKLLFAIVSLHAPISSQRDGCEMCLSWPRYVPPLQDIQLVVLRHQRPLKQELHWN